MAGHEMASFRKNLDFPEARKPDSGSDEDSPAEESDPESSSVSSSLENRPLSSFKHGVRDDNTEEVDSEEESSALKTKQKSKKKGRKSSWAEVQVDEMVDIVCSNEYYKRKLIFTNTKNEINAQVYDKVREEVKTRFKARDDSFPFNAIQMRTKFKRCIAECKKVALTVKTATGINNFLEEKQYGKWFNQLYALVKTRESCNPDMAIEPSAEIQKRKKSTNDAKHDPNVGNNLMDSSNDSSDGITDKSMSVPVKRPRKRNLIL